MASFLSKTGEEEGNELEYTQSMAQGHMAQLQKE
jgi:hypothetical protein